MTIESLALMTLRAGVNDINTDIHNIGTPTSMMFDEPKNQKIEPGHGVAGNILYKRENSQYVRTGADTYLDEPLDPFQHVQEEWSYTAVTVVLDGKEIQKNLGGATLDELASGNIMSSIPAGGRATLVNMIAPRLTNLKITLDEKMAADFYTHGIDDEGREGIKGIDIITTPDTAYGGLDYNSLGPLPFKSTLLKYASGATGAAEMWNPLTLDLGSDSLELKHFTAAATDLTLGSMYGIEKPNPARPMVVFAMSPGRYNNSPMMLDYHEQRRRTSAGDVEASPTAELVDSRLNAKFMSDPNIDDDGIVYFWQEGRLKKWMQKRKRYAELLKRSRLTWNQDRVLIIAEIECQFFTLQRWSMGWMKTTAGF